MQKCIFLKKSPTIFANVGFFCIFAAKIESSDIMSTKRMTENLAYLLEIEQDMTSKGKRMSPAFLTVKRRLQQAVGA